MGLKPFFQQHFICVFALLFCFKANSQSRSKADSLNTAFKNCTVDTQKIKILTDIGRLYAYKKPDTTISILRSALALAGKNEYDGIVANTLLTMGISYNAKAGYDSAEYYFLKAIDQASKYKKVKSEAAAYLGLGTCYNYWKKQPKALESYFNSYKLYKTINDSGRIASVSLGLGNVYSDIGNKDKALEFFNECLRLSVARKDSGYIAKCYNNIGNLYEKNKEFEKALEYFTKSLELKKILKDAHGIANTYTNLANVYILTNKQSLAKFFYTSAKDTYLALGDSGQYKNSLISIAECQISEKDVKGALENAKKAEAICKRNNYTADLVGVYILLTRLYILKGDTANARISLDSYQVTRDSVQLQDVNKQIAEMTAKFESDLQKQKISLQEAELQLGKKLTIVYIITTIIFVLLIAFLLVVISRYRKTQRLLEEKNRAIEMKNKSTSRHS